MYEDTYRQFDPMDVPYGCYKTYNISSEEPEAEWDYGDSLTIKFDLRNKLNGIDLNCYNAFLYTVYNYRGDIMFEQESDVPEYEYICQFAGDIYLNIDHEVSMALIPGVYHCRVQLVQYSVQDNQENTISSAYTLISSSECEFHVR